MDEFEASGVRILFWSLGPCGWTEALKLRSGSPFPTVVYLIKDTLLDTGAREQGQKLLGETGNA